MTKVNAEKVTLERTPEGVLVTITYDRPGPPVRLFIHSAKVGTLASMLEWAARALPGSSVEWHA